SCWSTRSTCRGCPGARPACATASGSLTCCAMACWQPASFHPSRYATCATLIQERALEVNRVQQGLESANLKVAAVATDVLENSGRTMLEALLGGERDPDTLAELARGRLRAKLPELRQALEGRVRPVHLVQLRVLLANIEFLEGALAQLQEEIAALLNPFAEAVVLAQTLSGVGQTAANALIAELGTDMSRFPTHKHLASWAGVCPGNKQSGGKRLSSKTTKGNTRLRSVLVEVVWNITRIKDNYLSAQYHRLARRMEKQKAAMAVAHSLP